MTHTPTSYVSYVLITDAHSLLAKAHALDLAKNHQHLLLIGKPHEGLMEWAHQLMTYGVEVDFFETDHSDPHSLALLADWIHNSYPVSRFLNLAAIPWMEEIFEPRPFQEKKVA
jgi:short-subunit dehydrogenase